jgi:drug/metabolite transporter (DMT)-like permease
MMSNYPKKWKPWVAFAAVSFFWGTTYLAIRIGVQSFPPLLMAAFRHCLGGLVLCTYFMGVKGHKLPGKKTLYVVLINGVLMLVLGNGLVTWAEITVSSGLAALICSLTPVWIIGINAFGKYKEPITWNVVLGLMIALFGQALIFRDNLSDFSNPLYFWGIVAILIANAAWALGSVYSKNHRSEMNPLFGAGLQMIAGGVILLILGSIKGEWSHMHPNRDGILALVYLFTFGSIIAYSAYMYILKALPASVVSSYAYINTIVAVFLGWFILDEKLNFITLVAVFLTIAGVYLLNNTIQKSVPESKA